MIPIEEESRQPSVMTPKLGHHNSSQEDIDLSENSYFKFTGVDIAIKEFRE